MLIRSIFSGGSPVEIIQAIVFGVCAVLFSMTLHEFAHAFVAHLMGDDTAKNLGRMSLNPVRHLNPIGLILLLLFGFGWANPVIINPRNFKKPKAGIILTSVAGPLMNFLCGFVSVFFCVLLREKYPGNLVLSNLADFLNYFLLYSINFGVFNLIPFPPLDGSRVVAELLPLKYRLKYYSLERYSMYFFIGLILVLNYFNFVSLISASLIRLFVNILF